MQKRHLGTLICRVGEGSAYSPVREFSTTVPCKFAALLLGQLSDRAVRVPILLDRDVHRAISNSVAAGKLKMLGPLYDLAKSSKHLAQNPLGVVQSHSE